MSIQDLMALFLAFQSFSSLIQVISNQLIRNNFKVIETAFVLNYHKLIEHKSVFVTKKFDGISLLDFYRNDNKNSEKKEALICLLKTLSDFFKKGFFHNDIRLENFLITHHKPYEITFLDFDAISRKRWLSAKQVLYALGMLNYSIFDYLTSQNKQHLYTRDQVLFYLDLFLKSYDPSISVDKAYQYVTRATNILLDGSKERMAKNSALLLKMIN